MFENLKKYNKILVTGPQRSGTRIAAKMIAIDTGYDYIDEECFNVSNRDKLREILKRDGIVVQCPAVSAWIQEFSTDNTLIVFMKRSIKDILDSQKRIRWEQKTELAKYIRKKGVISKIKYETWIKEQIQEIKNWIDLPYESLDKHPLWIPKEKRLDFKYNQTE